mgnify:CR=1 FL=1
MLECHEWLEGEGGHDHVLELTYELRTRSRLRAETEGGLEVGLFLPRGRVLAQGERLQCNDGSVLMISAAPEQLSRVHCDHALLLAHDSDPFNRAEAARRLGMDVLVDMVAGSDADPLFLDAMAAIAGDNSADPAFRALALALPSEDEIAAELHGRGIIPNPANIHTVRHKASRSVASRLAPTLDRLFAEMDVAGPYSPAAEPAGKRALRLRALSLMMDRDGPDGPAAALFASADNMTESLAALGCLISANVAGDALSAFHSRWKDNPNVLDKWFALQAARSNPADALDAVKNLSEHADFTWKTPNRFRSLLGGFAQNHAGFHRDDGAGYALYCDWLLRLDPLNPQIAARMITAFETWARYDTRRQDLMKAQMDRIAASPNLESSASTQAREHATSDRCQLPAAWSSYSSAFPHCEHCIPATCTVLNIHPCGRKFMGDLPPYSGNCSASVAPGPRHGLASGARAQA